MSEIFTWPPEPYLLILTGVGVLIALTAWLPLALRRLPLSLPILAIAAGALLGATIRLPFTPLPGDHLTLVQHGTELVVLIALMGAGLKIDRPFGWRRWGITWRLLGPTMLLTIAAVTLLGVYFLRLPWPVAILLGAVLAPTDPVLAADVQVGPPKSGEEDEVRFGLTSEAGLNDAFAFPFVHLAIALAATGATGEAWAGRWILHNLVWEVVAGAGIGLVIGWLFGWLTFYIPAESKLAQTGDGVIAIAATLVTYGLCEMAESYGFLGVFVAALAIRHSHRSHDFQRDMHDFTEQVERLAMMAGLLLFGAALTGGLLDALGWRDAVFAVLLLIAIRPLAGAIGLIGSPIHRTEKPVLAFFGIRGVGSVFYLAYGLNHISVTQDARLWSLVGLVILLSIVMHGLTVTPAMRALDRRHGRDPDAPAE